jgi:dihydrofolate reductase
MSKLVVSEFMTLDGVVEAPEQWSFAYADDAIQQMKLDEIQSCRALLLGRITFQLFAGVWPGRTDPFGFAARFNSMPKYVASTTLASAGWNGTVLQGDLQQAVTGLKDQPGGDLLVNGSPRLIQALMRHGLIDEYQLLVYPVVVGRGRRLFADDATATLKLTGSRAFDSGVVLLTYVPA